MTTPTSRSVSQVYRDLNPNPVIDARPCFHEKDCQ